MNDYRYVPMWLVNESLENEAVYHYGERERAKYLENQEPKEVWAVVTRDFFIGTWQFTDMEGIIVVFDTEKEAESYIRNVRSEEYENQ